MSDSHSAPIVVVGAGGFIGGALVARLAQGGAPVSAVVRRAVAVPRGVTLQAIGGITAASDWSALLRGARAVVHLASRAHAPPGADQEWIAGEAAAAAQFVRAAGRAGVERVVLVSSIKVLGEATDGVPFRAGRPAARGLPLPFASIANRRSLVFLDNLVDLVEVALVHPAARDGTFLLRDEEEVSTPELIRRIARALGRPARLFACPPSLLRLAARAAGRGAAADRVLGSLSIDDAATREQLGWRPRVALDDGLAATCRWYRGEQAGARP